MIDPDRPTRVLGDSKEAAAASLYQQIDKTRMFVDATRYHCSDRGEPTQVNAITHIWVDLDCVAMLLGRNNIRLPKDLQAYCRLVLL